MRRSRFGEDQIIGALREQGRWTPAAWRRRMASPSDITLMPPPPQAPDLNPVENLWRFIRDDGLSSRVFQSHDDILDHACAAWRRIVDQPWGIMTIGLHEWAHGSWTVRIGAGPSQWFQWRRIGRA